MLTVIIVTIGRPTLVNAISSAVKEGFPVIVVGDGIDVDNSVRQKFKRSNVRFERTGRRYGCYGAMAANLGMLLAETEYCAGLGDDDEFIENKGQIILNKIKEKPEIDIWIPNLLFDKNKEWYMRKEVKYGFTPCPIGKTAIITISPFVHPPHEKLNHAMDYLMIDRAVNVYGYKIDWINEPIYKLRPNYNEDHGAGNFGQIQFKMV